MKETIEVLPPEMANQFNTVFISYGRQHSLAFARKLYHLLVQHGYSAWFDMNDIPLGVDFQDQIDDGIRKADNFIFIISPHSIGSVYCYKELALALKYNKRIIPILHVEPQDDATWNKIDPEIAKRNWVQMKQSQDVAIRLSTLALEIKAEILEVPEAEWKFSGNFKDSFSGLVSLIESHKNHVHSHTCLLDLALAWNETQHNRQHLLVGKERTEMEEFLKRGLQPFRNPSGHLINSPCIPTRLMAEFIMESKKNGNNLQSDLFICHDIEDTQSVEHIRGALSQHGFSSWISTKDIAKGDEYTQAIHGGVVKSSNLLFFLSKKSLKSDYCKKEYMFALKYHKRIIPILLEPVRDSEIDDNDFPGLAHLQYISFTDLTHEIEVEIKSREDVKADVEARHEKTPFDISLDELLNTLHTNLSYHEEHRIYLVQATRWHERGQKSSFLLRGFNLENAQSWLRVNKNKSSYPPLNLHNEFITASVAAKGQLRTEVFISYSRKDSDFARQLNEQLQLDGKTTWFDQESISEGVNFEKEIFKGIVAADNFIFIISPDSVNSEYCEREVNYAVQMNKRFVSIKLRDTDTESIPEALRLINWIDFEDIEFGKSYPKLIQAIEIDREYARQHTILQQRALEWNENENSHDYLLNVPACEKAEDWLEKAGFDLPEIPHELLLQEVREKHADEIQKQKSLLQRLGKLTKDISKSLPVQVILGSYIWMVFLFVGFFVFNIVIGEGGGDFAMGAGIIYLLYLSAIPIWFFYKTLPLEIPLRKRSFKRFMLNIVGSTAGIAPGVFFFIMLWDYRTEWEIEDNIIFFGIFWGLGYYYALFELWLLLRFKKKRQKRALKNAAKTKRRNMISRFFRNIYVQTIFGFLFLKLVFGAADPVVSVTVFTILYLFEIIVLRIFSTDNPQEAVPKIEKPKRANIIYSAILIFVGWLVSLFFAAVHNISIRFTLDQDIIVLFFDYFGTLFFVWGLMRIKRWMRKTKKKTIYETDTVAELSQFYEPSDNMKVPVVSQKQIDYVHESRTAIAVSKIQLRITKNRLQMRLRVAWVLMLFMLLGTYSIFILSREVKLLKTSHHDNLAHLINGYILPMDTVQQEVLLQDLNLFEIPNTVLQLAELKHLSIQRCKLRHVQKEIRNLTYIQELTLTDNRLKELPSNFEKLTTLTKLNLSGNNFEKFPEVVTECSQITDLTIDNNKMKALSKDISKLKKLTTLQLKNNELSDLPNSIEELENLSVLILDNNEFEELPIAITRLKHLLELSISGNNELKSLPEDIGKLKTLRKLNLSGVAISELPVQIYELKALESLDLSYTYISQLPEGIAKLRNLKTLVLRSTLLSDEQVDSVRVILPNCKVEL